MNPIILGLHAISLLLLLGSCSSSGEPSGEQAASAEVLPVVYATNYPLAYFADRIAGPFAEVRFPAAGKGDPAFWEPSPEEVLAMQEADLILLNGATYEPWVQDVSLPLSRTVNTTGNLESYLIEVEGGVTHSHGEEGEHSHAGTAFTTWLDLSLAAEQAEAVHAALRKILPGQTTDMDENYQVLRSELLSMDEAWLSVTSQTRTPGILFSHPVYQYFQKRYGVEGQSLHWEPDAAPTEQMLADLRHELEHHPAQWMIWEGNPLPETITVLEGMGLSSVVVDPCGNRPGEGDFLQVMKRNTEQLKQVFGQAQ